MKKLLLVALLLGVGLVAPGVASSRTAGACGLPDGTPLWIDLAGSTVGFRAQVFAAVPAPSVVSQGPILGNRAIRLKLRDAAASLTSAGIDPSRIGLMLGFQSTGLYGRAGLQPLSARSSR